MTIRISRGSLDQGLQAIINALRPYAESHPDAVIDLYRQNPVSVRIRIVSREFDGKTRTERGTEVWPLLDRLPQEIHSDISTLLLLTPTELKSSYANLEFEDPVPSEL